MIGVSAQFSLYPLGQEDLAPAIAGAVDALKQRGLTVEIGGMSSTTFGDDEAVFDALRQAFLQAVEHGPAVMTITISNACPVVPPDDEESSDGA